MFDPQLSLRVISPELSGWIIVRLWKWILGLVSLGDTCVVASMFMLVDGSADLLFSSCSSWEDSRCFFFPLASWFFFLFVLSQFGFDFIFLLHCCSHVLHLFLTVFSPLVLGPAWVQPFLWPSVPQTELSIRTPGCATKTALRILPLFSREGTYRLVPSWRHRARAGRSDPICTLAGKQSCWWRNLRASRSCRPGEMTFR